MYYTCAQYSQLMTYLNAGKILKKSVYGQSLSGAARMGDWGRANLCKGLKVPFCLIPLVQIMFHIIWK